MCEVGSLKSILSFCFFGQTGTNYYLFFNRTIGKASSETRFYFAASKSYLLEMSSDLLNAKAVKFGGPLNARASYICGQDIYGDSILASIGYTWKGQDLFHEDVTLQSYYRSLLPSHIKFVLILFSSFRSFFTFGGSNYFTVLLKTLTANDLS